MSLSIKGCSTKRELYFYDKKLYSIKENNYQDNHFWYFNFLKLKGKPLRVQKILRKKYNFKLPELNIKKIEDKLSDLNLLKTNKYLKSYKIEEIIPLILDFPEIKEKFYIYLNDYKIKINSLRLQTFKKSIKCQHCGIEGNIFYLVENSSKQVHLDLFYENNNKKILMTSDHIIPISRNGTKKHINNRQTLCEICNSKKANKLEEEL